MLNKIKRKRVLLPSDIAGLTYTQKQIILNYRARKEMSIPGFLIQDSDDLRFIRKNGYTYTIKHKENVYYIKQNPDVPE